MDYKLLKGQNPKLTELESTKKDTTVKLRSDPAGCRFEVEGSAARLNFGPLSHLQSTLQFTISTSNRHEYWTVYLYADDTSTLL